MLKKLFEQTELLVLQPRVSLQSAWKVLLHPQQVISSLGISVYLQRLHFLPVHRGARVGDPGCCPLGVGGLEACPPRGGVEVFVGIVISTKRQWGGGLAVWAPSNRTGVKA